MARIVLTYRGSRERGQDDAPGSAHATRGLPGADDRCVANWGQIHKVFRLATDKAGAGVRVVWIRLAVTPRFSRPEDNPANYVWIFSV